MIEWSTLWSDRCRLVAIVFDGEFFRINVFIFWIIHVSATHRFIRRRDRLVGWLLHMQRTLQWEGLLGVLGERSTVKGRVLVHMYRLVNDPFGGSEGMVKVGVLVYGLVLIVWGSHLVVIGWERLTSAGAVSVLVATRGGGVGGSGDFVISHWVGTVVSGPGYFTWYRLTGYYVYIIWSLNGIPTQYKIMVTNLLS